MPVRVHENENDVVLLQREQYAKGGIGRWYWDLRDETVFREVPVSTASILDAGCGEGITLEKMVRRFGGKTVTGVDILETNIAVCEQYSLPVKRADLQDTGFRENSFDCCTLIEVIEHIRNADRVFGELHRILAKKGVLIVVYPNDKVFKWARTATLKFREAAYNPGHVFQWTPRRMEMALIRNGYAVLKTTCIPFRFWPLCLHGVTVAVKK